MLYPQYLHRWPIAPTGRYRASQLHLARLRHTRGIIFPLTVSELPDRLMDRYFLHELRRFTRVPVPLRWIGYGCRWWGCGRPSLPKSVDFYVGTQIPDNWQWFRNPLIPATCANTKPGLTVKISYSTLMRFEHSHRNPVSLQPSHLISAAFIGVRRRWQ